LRDGSVHIALNTKFTRIVNSPLFSKNYKQFFIFMADTECDRLIELGKRALQRSQTILPDGKHGVDQARTSSGSFLAGPLQLDPTVRAVEARPYPAKFLLPMDHDASIEAFDLLVDPLTAGPGSGYMVMCTDAFFTRKFQLQDDSATLSCMSSGSGLAAPISFDPFQAAEPLTLHLIERSTRSLICIADRL
jgi:hypothetical protein